MSVAAVSMSVVVGSVGTVSASPSRSRCVAGSVVVTGSVTVSVDTDVVPGEVSVGVGSVGRVREPVGRVTPVSGGSPEPSPPHPPRR